MVTVFRSADLVLSQPGGVADGRGHHAVRGCLLGDLLAGVDAPAPLVGRVDGRTRGGHRVGPELRRPGHDARCRLVAGGRDVPPPRADLGSAASPGRRARRRAGALRRRGRPPGAGPDRPGAARCGRPLHDRDRHPGPSGSAAHRPGSRRRGRGAGRHPGHGPRGGERSRHAGRGDGSTPGQPVDPRGARGHRPSGHHRREPGRAGRPRRSGCARSGAGGRRPPSGPGVVDERAAPRARRRRLPHPGLPERGHRDGRERTGGDRGPDRRGLGSGTGSASPSVPPTSAARPAGARRRRGVGGSSSCCREDVPGELSPPVGRWTWPSPRWLPSWRSS